MKSSLRMLLVASVISTVALPLVGKTGRGIHVQQALYIHLYDQAQVSAGKLKSATDESERIFTSAGIKIRWLTSQDELPEDQGLDMSSTLPRHADERHYLVLRIMRKAPAVFPGALGFALPFAPTGAHVSIFYDRVEALARSSNEPVYVILGHAMAHEIGHVLLNSVDHSSGGLMQEYWKQGTWRLASNGLLTFLPEQKKRIYERVSKLDACDTCSERPPALRAAFRAQRTENLPPQTVGNTR